MSTNRLTQPLKAITALSAIEKHFLLNNSFRNVDIIEELAHEAFQDRGSEVWRDLQF